MYLIRPSHNIDHSKLDSRSRRTRVSMLSATQGIFKKLIRSKFECDAQKTGFAHISGSACERIVRIFFRSIVYLMNK